MTVRVPEVHDTLKKTMLVDGYPFLLEFNVLFGTDALNRAGIDLKPLILDYLADAVVKAPMCSIT